MECSRKKRVRRRLWQSQGERCLWCGDRVAEAHITIDHVIPKAMGGRNHVENMVAACQPCNSGRGALSVRAFLAAIAVQRP